MRRRRSEMRLISVALAVLLLISTGVVVSHLGNSERGKGNTVPVQPPSGSSVNPPTTPAQSTTEAPPTPQPQHPPARAGASSGLGHHPGSQPVNPQNADHPVRQQLPPTPNDRPQTSPGQVVAEGAPSSSPPEASSSTDVASSSDRYPGSEPIKVDVELPNIGVPVSTEVYSTSDPVNAVISYYKQRYPNATVTEVEGQQIIAINSGRETKVIAVGTTGSETRIAIVKPK